jgi:uncharacterized membrane protein
MHDDYEAYAGKKRKYCQQQNYLFVRAYVSMYVCLSTAQNSLSLSKNKIREKKEREEKKFSTFLIHYKMNITLPSNPYKWAMNLALPSTQLSHSTADWTKNFTEMIMSLTILDFLRLDSFHWFYFAIFVLPFVFIAAYLIVHTLMLFNNSWELYWLKIKRKKKI